MLDMDFTKNKGTTFCGNPGICAECANQGPTCCRCGTTEEELVAPLSGEEWQRMVRLVPWIGNGRFVVREHNSHNFIQGIQALFPGSEHEALSSFPLGGDHLRLAQNNLGQCSLLGPGGCLLPEKARPYFCLMYPFWFTGETLKVFGDPHCLAVRSLHTRDSLCAALDTHPEKLSRLYSRLCLAWGIPPPKRYPVTGDRSMDSSPCSLQE